MQCSVKFSKNIFLCSMLLCVCTLPAHLNAQSYDARMIQGDRFYTEKNYDLALLQYRTLYSIKESENQKIDVDLRGKIALTLMRKGNYKESLTLLTPVHPFPMRYLRGYGFLRSGYMQEAEREFRMADLADDLTKTERSRMNLLKGTLYLERGAYEEAKDFYNNLSLTSVDPDVTQASKDTLKAIQTYKNIPAKSPILSALFSTILPGAGQVYSRHTLDGLSAFFINAVLIGSTASLYSMERELKRPHHASGAVGSIAFVFYLSNVTGAYNSARRYNIYRERKFQEEIRNRFLSNDFIEHQSEIRFVSRF